MTSRLQRVRDAWRRYVLLQDGYDDRNFREEAGRTTRLAFRIVLIGVMAATVLWWPTDWLLYDDQPAVLRAVATWRITILAGGAVFLLLDRFTSLTDRYPIAFGGAVCIYGPAAVTIPLSWIGGPDSYWFHSIYGFPVPTLALQAPPGKRLLVLLLGALAGPVAWILPHPEYRQAQGLGTIAGLYIFEITAMMMFGQVIYWLSRSRFQQLEILARALEVDRARLREMIAFQDRVLAAERARLSHDLHDVIGQSLTVLRLQLDGVRLVQDAPPHPVWTRINTQLEQIFQELRAVIAAQRQQFERPQVLIESIEQLAHAIGREARLDIAVELGDCPLVYDRAITTFEICREALTNVVRHSGARRVWITGHRSGDDYLLTIADDGRGLAADVRPGTGTASMRERAGTVGAALSIENVPVGAGARVRVWFPAEPAVEHAS